MVKLNFGQYSEEKHTNEKTTSERKEVVSTDVKRNGIQPLSIDGLLKNIDPSGDNPNAKDIREKLKSNAFASMSKDHNKQLEQILGQYSYLDTSASRGSLLMLLASIEKLEKNFVESKKNAMVNGEKAREILSQENKLIKQINDIKLSGIAELRGVKTDLSPLENEIGKILNEINNYSFPGNIPIYGEKFYFESKIELLTGLLNLKKGISNSTNSIIDNLGVIIPDMIENIGAKEVAMILGAPVTVPYSLFISGQGDDIVNHGKNGEWLNLSGDVLSAIIGGLLMIEIPTILTTALGETGVRFSRDIGGRMGMNRFLAEDYGGSRGNIIDNPNTPEGQERLELFQRESIIEGLRIQIDAMSNLTPKRKNKLLKDLELLEKYKLIKTDTFFFKAYIIGKDMGVNNLLNPKYHYAKFLSLINGGKFLFPKDKWKIFGKPEFSEGFTFSKTILTPELEKLTKKGMDKLQEGAKEIYTGLIFEWNNTEHRVVIKKSDVLAGKADGKGIEFARNYLKGKVGITEKERERRNKLLDNYIEGFNKYPFRVKSDIRADLYKIVELGLVQKAEFNDEIKKEFKELTQEGLLKEMLDGKPTISRWQELKNIIPGLRGEKALVYEFIVAFHNGDIDCTIDELKELISAIKEKRIKSIYGLKTKLLALTLQDKLSPKIMQRIQSIDFGNIDELNSRIEELKQSIEIGKENSKINEEIHKLEKERELLKSSLMNDLGLNDLSINNDIAEINNQIKLADQQLERLSEDSLERLKLKRIRLYLLEYKLILLEGINKITSNSSVIDNGNKFDELKKEIEINKKIQGNKVELNSSDIDDMFKKGEELKKGFEKGSDIINGSNGNTIIGNLGHIIDLDFKRFPDSVEKIFEKIVEETQKRVTDGRLNYDENRAKLEIVRLYNLCLPSFFIIDIFNGNNPYGVNPITQGLNVEADNVKEFLKLVETGKWIGNMNELTDVCERLKNGEKIQEKIINFDIDKEIGEINSEGKRLEKLSFKKEVYGIEFKEGKIDKQSLERRELELAKLGASLEGRILDQRNFNALIESINNKKIDYQVEEFFTRLRDSLGLNGVSLRDNRYGYKLKIDNNTTRQTFNSAIAKHYGDIIMSMFELYDNKDYIEKEKVIKKVAEHLGLESKWGKSKVLEALFDSGYHTFELQKKFDDFQSEKHKYEEEQKRIEDEKRNKETYISSINAKIQNLDGITTIEELDERKKSFEKYIDDNSINRESASYKDLITEFYNKVNKISEDLNNKKIQDQIDAENKRIEQENITKGKQLILDINARINTILEYKTNILDNTTVTNENLNDIVNDLNKRGLSLVINFIYTKEVLIDKINTKIKNLNEEKILNLRKIFKTTSNIPLEILDSDKDIKEIVLNLFKGRLESLGIEFELQKVYEKAELKDKLELERLRTEVEGAKKVREKLIEIREKAVKPK